MKNLLKRIEINPSVLQGKPVIKGTRIPISLILNLLSHGYEFRDITNAYPELSVEDILAAIEFASKLSEYKEVELETSLR